VAALTLAQEEGHGTGQHQVVNLLNQVVVIQKVQDGQVPNAHVNLQKWTLEAIVESQLMKIVCH
jgi:hypothetical protein